MHRQLRKHLGPFRFYKGPELLVDIRDYDCE